MRTEKPQDSRPETRRFLQLTFPNRKNVPTHRTKLFPNPNISGLIAIEFRVPVKLVRTRTIRSSRTRVAVPKAAMNKNQLSLAWKNHVGTTRQRAYVQPISIAQRMHKPAHDHFRTCVLASNSLHRCSSIR